MLLSIRRLPSLLREFVCSNAQELHNLELVKEFRHCIARMQDLLSYRENQRVRKYYSETGWTMFDARHLTEPIKQFLTNESKELDAILADKSYDTLVEIGCGYGRHMQAALKLGLNYEGLDLVNWLTEIGTLRVQQLGGLYPNLRCRISNDSITAIDKLEIGEYSNRALVLFPFNCFGNLSCVESALDVLSTQEFDLLISTFETDKKTTHARKEYYENCGSQVAGITEDEDGVQIESIDGLKSFAPDPIWLETILARFGFVLVGKFQYCEIGGGYLFKKAELCSSIDRRKTTRQEIRSPIRLQFLSPPKDGTGLLSFYPADAEVCDISENGILVESSVNFEPGTIVRLEAIESEEKDHEDNSSAELVTALADTDCGIVVRKFASGEYTKYGIEF